MEPVVRDKVKRVITNIIAARMHRSYKQDYMGVMLKMSQAAYSKIEVVLTRLTIDKLFHIAEILQIDCHDLIRGTF